MRQDQLSALIPDPADYILVSIRYEKIHVCSYLQWWNSQNLSMIFSLFLYTAVFHCQSGKKFQVPGLSISYPRLAPRRSGCFRCSLTSNWRGTQEVSHLTPRVRPSLHERARCRRAYSCRYRRMTYPNRSCRSNVPTARGQCYLRHPLSGSR